MRRAPLFLVVFALAVSAMASDLKSTIKSTNAKVCAAFMKKDMNGFETITRPMVTSDFKCIQMGQTETYDQMVSTMKPQFDMFSKVTSANAKATKIAQKGNNATVNMDHHMTMQSVGPDKKKHKWTWHGTSVDNWVKEGKEWKLAKMDWKSHTMTMDGKPFNPQAAPGGQGK